MQVALEELPAHMKPELQRLDSNKKLNIPPQPTHKTSTDLMRFTPTKITEKKTEKLIYSAKQQRFKKVECFD